MKTWLRVVHRTNRYLILANKCTLDWILLIPFHHPSTLAYFVSISFCPPICKSILSSHRLCSTSSLQFPIFPQSPSPDDLALRLRCFIPQWSRLIYRVKLRRNFSTSSWWACMLKNAWYNDGSLICFILIGSSAVHLAESYMTRFCVHYTSTRYSPSPPPWHISRKTAIWLGQNFSKHSKHNVVQWWKQLYL